MYTRATARARLLIFVETYSAHPSAAPNGSPTSTRPGAGISPSPPCHRDLLRHPIILRAVRGRAHQPQVTADRRGPPMITVQGLQSLGSTSLVQAVSIIVNLVAAGR